MKNVISTIVEKIPCPVCGRLRPDTPSPCPHCGNRC